MVIRFTMNEMLIYSKIDPLVLNFSFNKFCFGQSISEIPFSYEPPILILSFTIAFLLISL